VCYTGGYSHCLATTNSAKLTEKLTHLLYFWYSGTPQISMSRDWGYASLFAISCSIAEDSEENTGQKCKKMALAGVKTGSCFAKKKFKN